MLINTECVTKMVVGTTPETRILSINPQMIGACCAYWRVCQELGVPAVITGAARERIYSKEPLHMKGLAWDFRCCLFPDPDVAFERFRAYLVETDPNYRVVYIQPPKPMHFHVEWCGQQGTANERGP